MRSPDSRKWAFTFMPSTSVPTLVSRSISLKRPSVVASIWQWSGSAAGSSSWIEFVSARPIVTTPPSNSKTRSSWSVRQIVSLGMECRYFRERRKETEGGIHRGVLFLAHPEPMSDDFTLIMISAMYENGGNTTHRLLDGHPQLYTYPFESQLGTALVRDYLKSMFPQKYRWPV